MPHHNAKLTPRGREQLVRLVVDQGFSYGNAAAWGHVSKSTVWEWVGRYRAATPEDRSSLACFCERSSRPQRSPSQLPAEEAQKICELRKQTGWSARRIACALGRPHSTVHRALRRGGCSRRPRPERPAIVRYQWPCPGNLLHMDIKKLNKFSRPGHALTGDRSKRSKKAGWEYVHSILDDCSRLAYSEIHEDEKAETTTAFTRRALDWFLQQGVVAERLMTDNGFTYTKNRSLACLLRSSAIRHLRTRPYPPRTNGKVERYQQTLQREWAYALEYASSSARREALPHWLEYYNHKRSHSALSNRPPIARVREMVGHNS